LKKVLGLASEGNGSAEFVASNERMERKVISLLKRATEPVIDKVRLEISGLENVSIFPALFQHFFRKIKPSFTDLVR
jgi:hypothetical protein